MANRRQGPFRSGSAGSETTPRARRGLQSLTSSGWVGAGLEVDGSGKLRIRATSPLRIDGSTIGVDTDKIIKAKAPLEFSGGEVRLRKSTRTFTRPSGTATAATNAAQIDDILLALAELGLIEL